MQKKKRAIYQEKKKEKRKKDSCGVESKTIYMRKKILDAIEKGYNMTVMT